MDMKKKLIEDYFFRYKAIKMNQNSGKIKLMSKKLSSPELIKIFQEK